MTDTTHSREQDRRSGPQYGGQVGTADELPSPERRLPTWLLVVVGVVSVVAGVLALAWPLATLAALAVLLGVAVLVDGIGALVEGIVGPPGSGRGGRALVGLLGVVVGLVALRYPGATLLTLAFAAGAWLVVAGVVAVAEAWTDDMDGRGVRTVLAVVEVVVGVVVLGWPPVGLASFALLIGWALCVRGVATIVIAVVSRRHRPVAASGGAS